MTQATLERMPIKMMHRKIFSVEEWGTNEISTRNCRHCHADFYCYLVTCARGYSLKNDRGYPYMYNYIVKYPHLIDPCQSCADLDCREV